MLFQLLWGRNTGCSWIKATIHKSFNPDVGLSDDDGRLGMLHLL